MTSKQDTADTGFEIKIDLGNESMSQPLHMAEALRGIAYEVESGNRSDGNIRDANGNTVGFWRFVQHDEPLGRWAGGGPILPEDL